eukprot:scaffold7654_cov258-Pinguiococcus_pyrenoidosus.AAC.5
MILQECDQRAAHGQAGSVERVRMDCHLLGLPLLALRHRQRLAVPEAHAPRLEVAAVAHAADLSVHLLAWKPDFQVVANLCPEPDVAAAEQHSPVGQLELLEHALGGAEHLLLSGHTVVRLLDAHHLDLVELMLPEHTAGVSSIAAGLGSETRREAAHLHRDLRGLDELPAVHGSQRHLCRRNEKCVLVSVDLVRDLEQVVLKLGKLTRGAEATPRDNQGHAQLFVALLRQLVQEELRERPLELGNRPSEHAESGAAQPSRCLGIDAAKLLVHGERKGGQGLGR